MANTVTNKIWPGANLQSRRWLFDQRLEAVEQNNVANLQQLLDLQSALKSKELTKHLEVAILKKSDSYLHCIRILLSRGASPCGVNGVGTPFLLIAAEAGCVGVVNLLLQAKCNPNQTREDGATGTA